MNRASKQSRGGLCRTAALAVALLGLGGHANADPAADVIIPWLSGDHVLAEGSAMTADADSTAAASPAPAFLQRPRLSVSLIDPAAGESGLFSNLSGIPVSERFSLGANQWRQVDGASPAHIQCRRGTLTGDSYLAEDCRLVAEPAPRDSTSLMQFGGQWMATSNFNLGLGLFRGQSPVVPFSPEIRNSLPAMLQPDTRLHDSAPGTPLNLTEGMDVNLSLGLEAGRVGDFLLDLQVARYRDGGHLASYQNAEDLPGEPARMYGARRYQNAAQLSLGWNRGDFSGGIVGQYRDPLRSYSAIDYAGNQAQSSFDIEFSWRAPWNASFTLGASNVLDQQPAEAPPETLDDAGDSMFGRIPYVRYKQDL